MNETRYLTSALTELLQLWWLVLLCVQQVVQPAHGVILESVTNQAAEIKH